MSEAVLECRGLAKTYQGPAPVEVLRGVDFAVHARERVAIMGKSGSGKSTLLHLLGGLDAPTAGSVSVAGRPFSAMGEAERGRVRNATLGFVYQFHHLLPEFSALENVAMPLLIRRMERAPALEKARAALTDVGLGARLLHQPGELSGGERQRVAIARGLANGPALLLADEPTGNLDSETAAQVLALIFDVARSAGAALIVVTHDPEIARKPGRRIELRDGRVVADTANGAGAPPPP